jgi:hypothetical protein
MLKSFFHRSKPAGAFWFNLNEVFAFYCVHHSEIKTCPCFLSFQKYNRLYRFYPLLTMEPLYARRQQSDYFTTSPAQYNLFGRFGEFSPRYTIKNKYPDKSDPVFRLPPSTMPRSPQYSGSYRSERTLNSPSTRTDAVPNQVTGIPLLDLPSLEEIEIPKVDRGEGPWPDFSEVKPRFKVQEPDYDFSSSRSLGLSKKISQKHEGTRCGPVGKPDYRRLPDLDPGRRWTIRTRETADFVR